MSGRGSFSLRLTSGAQVARRLLSVADMVRPALLALAFASFSCGSHVEFFPTSVTAVRESDGKVLITARAGLTYLGVQPSEVRITQSCMQATWSEGAPTDAGAGDGGSGDGGTSDAGVSGAPDGGVTALPRTSVGATLSTVTQCLPGTSGTFELRSPDAIPERLVIVTLAVTATQEARSGGPLIERDLQFFSP